ncbi:MAG TPA: hypothetical protein VNW23_01355 [Opitutaceae bacterium]|nr:hypothetical protein [Opitutaceae bacterium]
MFIIIGGDGKEYGPETASQVNGWISSGRANLQTKARRLDEDTWKTLGDFPEFCPVPMTTPPPLANEAAPSSASADPRTLDDDLPAHVQKLEIGACLSRGWDLWMRYFGQLVQVTFLLIAICVVIGASSLVSNYLAITLAFLLSGMLSAGMFHYTLKLLRGEPANLSDLFSGFGQAARPLILASFLIGFVSECPAIFQQSNPALLQAAPMKLVYVALQILVIYLSIGWAFTYPLILEKKLAFWPAMKMSRRVIAPNWWRMLLLMFVAALLSLLGIVALFIGIFLTLPLYFCVLACAYDALCNPKNNLPVQPAAPSSV